MIPVAAVRFKPPKSVVSDKKILLEKNIPKELSTIYSVSSNGQLSELYSNGDFGRKIHRNYKGFEVGNRVVTGEINMQKKKIYLVSVVVNMVPLISAKGYLRNIVRTCRNRLECCKI